MQNKLIIFNTERPTLHSQNFKVNLFFCQYNNINNNNIIFSIYLVSLQSLRQYSNAKDDFHLQFSTKQFLCILNKQCFFSYVRNLHNFKYSQYFFFQTIMYKMLQQLLRSFLNQKLTLFIGKIDMLNFLSFVRNLHNFEYSKYFFSNNYVQNVTIIITIFFKLEINSVKRQNRYAQFSFFCQKFTQF
eukprot:TRINITY_DN388_c0_g1_i3.p2 TRINITY_DN388_c0_g1~~TRINITY_DN388_c0_g1_i3.p2  ORF type:complete len:212 (-),score=-22.42 TRINITY_DN388_c0_g1_i3:351-911(-)